MPVKIDMDMPCGCVFCPYKSTKGIGLDQRIYCVLTRIEFDAWEYRNERFELCPLKEVKP